MELESLQKMTERFNANEKSFTCGEILKIFFSNKK